MSVLACNLQLHGVRWVSLAYLVVMAKQNKIKWLIECSEATTECSECCHDSYF